MSTTFERRHSCPPPAGPERHFLVPQALTTFQKQTFTEKPTKGSGPPQTATKGSLHASASLTPLPPTPTESVLCEGGSPELTSSSGGVERLLEDFKHELLEEIHRIRDDRKHLHNWLESLRTQICQCIEGEASLAREKNDEFWEARLSEQMQVLQTTRADAEEAVRRLHMLQRNSRPLLGERPQEAALSADDGGDASTPMPVEPPQLPIDNSWNSPRSLRQREFNSSPTMRYSRSRLSTGDDNENLAATTRQQSKRDTVAFQEAEGWKSVGGGHAMEKVKVLEIWRQAGLPTSKWSDRLQLFSMTLIFLNLVFMGVDMSFAMASLKSRTAKPVWVDIVELIFALTFILELAMRIAWEGMQFFMGPNWKWNTFDFALGISPLLDILLSVINLSFMRSAKAFRTIRAARMIKGISFVRELRLMVASILCSTVSLMWAFALVTLMVYTFSLFIMQTVEVHAREHGLENLDERTLEYFGTFYDAMLYLFMCISGGIDWKDVLNPLLQISSWYAIAFVSYVIFVLFGVMNILTAIFVSSASDIAAIDRDLVIQETIAKDNSTVNELKRVFCDADDTGTGLISKAVLETQLSESETVAYLKTLGLDVSETRGLFQLLDIDDEDYVDIEEFICGMMRLKGTGVDIATVMYENKRILTRLTAFMRFVEDHLSRLNKDQSADPLGEMRTYLSAAIQQSRSGTDSMGCADSAGMSTRTTGRSKNPSPSAGTLSIPR